MNILVFKVNGLGDTIQIIPTIQSIKSEYPKYNIYVVTTRIGYEVIKYVIPKENIRVIGKSDAKSFFKVIRLFFELSKYNFQIFKTKH